VVRLILASAIVVALAGSHAPAPDQPIKSSIDIVRVDVNAVNGSGQPVPDLTIEDFDLRVDGRGRAITSVQFVPVPAGAADRPPEPAHYSSNAGAAGGRLIMIAVDRATLSTARARAALKAASAFVASLNRADRVALATIPHGPQVGFTADHELVQRLVLEIDGTAVDSFGNHNIGISDALAFERRDDLTMQLITERECGAASVGANQRSGSSEVMICQGEVKAEALLVAAHARERSRQTITGLQALLGGFPPSQTPKILVLISEGLVIQGEPSPLSWLDERAAAAHVTIYPIRLETSGADASQRRAPANVMLDRTVQEDGLAAIAQATGGEMFRLISNSNFAFERLAAELSGYYLLGFEPDTGERDGRPHALEVRVRRPGVTVRSRREFTIPVAAVTAPDTEIVKALRDPLPVADIPLRLTTYAFHDPRRDQTRLFMAAEIDRSADPNSKIAVGYVIVDFDGQLIASRMDSALPSPGPDGPSVQAYVSDVALDPGKYTVKLAVVDDFGRRGSVERVADAVLTEAGPVRVSELLLGSARAAGSALPLVPVISGDIAQGALHAYLELFADRPDSFEGVNVTLEIAPSSEAKALQRVPVPLVTQEEDRRLRVASARLDPERLPPGEYVARAVIAVGFDTVGQVTRPFRVPSRPR
jgi:VWFA-related protein